MTRSLCAGILAAAGLTLLGGCWRDADGVYVTAPFNDRTKLAEVSAVWRNTGEERAFAEATRLDEPQVRFQYRVDVRNQLDDRLYLRVGKLQLLDEGGLAVAGAADEVTCVAGPGETEALLEGSVWVPKRAAGSVAAFRVERFGVPLSERGRGMYREWLLQSRPEEGAAIDAELGRYASAPACR